MDHNISASSASPPPAPSPSTNPPPPKSSLMIAQEYDRALRDGDYSKAVELVEAAFSQCDADDVGVPSCYEAVIQQCECGVADPESRGSVGLFRRERESEKPTVGDYNGLYINKVNRGVSMGSCKDCLSCERKKGMRVRLCKSIFLIWL